MGPAPSRGKFLKQINSETVNWNGYAAPIYSWTEKNITRSTIQQCNGRLYANTSTHLLFTTLTVNDISTLSYGNWAAWSLTDNTRWYFDGLSSKINYTGTSDKLSTLGTLPNHQLRKVVYIGNPDKSTDDCYLFALTNYGLFIGWDKTTSTPVSTMTDDARYCFKWINMSYDNVNYTSIETGSAGNGNPVSGYYDPTAYTDPSDPLYDPSDAQYPDQLWYPLSIGALGAFDIVCYDDTLYVTTGAGIWSIKLFDSINGNIVSYSNRIMETSYSNCTGTLTPEHLDPDDIYWRQRLDGTQYHAITKIQPAVSSDVYRNIQ